MSESSSLFLKNLPAALQAGQRVIFEAIDIACDIIDLEMEQILLLTSSLNLNNTDIPLTDRQRLTFVRSAWSIVDKIDSLRLIIIGQGEKLLFPLSDEYKEILCSARKLRNHIDHLGSNESKYPNNRKLLPIFGVISFNWYSQGDVTIKHDQRGTIATVKARNAAVIFASRAQHKFSLNTPGLFDSSVYNGVGNFRLFSHKESISLSSAHLMSQALRNHINTGLGKAWNETKEKAVVLNPAVAGRLDKTIHKLSVLNVRQTFPQEIVVQLSQAT